MHISSDRSQINLLDNKLLIEVGFIARFCKGYTFLNLIVFIELSAEKVISEMAAAVASSWETIIQNHHVARGISCRSLWTSMLDVSYFPFQER